MDDCRYSMSDVLGWFQFQIILRLQAIRLGYFLGLERLGMQAQDVDGKLVHDRDRG